MATVEQRLKALEKRVQIDDERWLAIAAQTTAFALVPRAIWTPLCAVMPAILPAIIKNLSTYEATARMTNEHVTTIEEFRRARAFFESLAKKNGNGGAPSVEPRGPRLKK